MSVGYNYLKVNEENNYSKYKNELLEAVYSFDDEKLTEIFSNSKSNCENNLIFNKICDVLNPFLTKKQIKKKLDIFKTLESVDKCDFSNNQLGFIYESSNISAKKLNKQFPFINQSDFKGYGVNINKYIAQTIKLSRNLEQPSTIVIGYLTEELDKIRKLHCWLEFEKDNKTYIIDFPNNLLINKDEYYMFTQPNIINKIDSNNLDDNIVDILHNIFQLEYEEIVCFYEELKKDIKKIR